MRQSALLPTNDGAQLEQAHPAVGAVGEGDQHEVVGVGQARLGSELAGELGLERFDHLRATMARVARGDDATVCIGAIPALPPELVPRLLARLAAATPQSAAVVRAVPGGRTAANLLDGGAFDIVLVRGPSDAPGLATALVAQEPVGVALPADHPLARQPSVAPADLNGVPLIVFARASDPIEYDRIFSVLAAAGLRDVRVAHESHPGAVDASLRLVASGVGAALKLASEVAAFGSPAVTWRPLDGVELDVVVSAAWRVDRVTPAVRRLVDLLGGVHRTDANEVPGGAC